MLPMAAHHTPEPCGNLGFSTTKPHDSHHCVINITVIIVAIASLKNTGRDKSLHVEESIDFFHIGGDRREGKIRDK